MFGLGTSELITFILICVLIVTPVWRICEKAGFPGWYGVAIAFPLLNLVLLYYLAFARWPATSLNDQLAVSDPDNRGATH